MKYLVLLLAILFIAVNSANARGGRRGSSYTSTATKGDGKTIHTGSRGGKYTVDANGKKHYIKK